jgi:hypothetical protein
MRLFEARRGRLCALALLLGATAVAATAGIAVGALAVAHI